MIGVLVATHGSLAKEFLNSAAMLVGEGEQIDSVCLLPGREPEDFLRECEEKAEKLDTGEGVVALVDIPGGTPNNTMIRLSKSRNIRILTGVNLPMVMIAVFERYDGMTEEELVSALLESGKEQITEFGKSN